MASALGDSSTHTSTRAPISELAPFWGAAGGFRVTRIEQFIEASTCLEKALKMLLLMAECFCEPMTIRSGFHPPAFFAITRTVEPTARLIRTSQSGKSCRIISLALLANAVA